jgi:thioesterase-3
MKHPLASATQSFEIFRCPLLIKEQHLDTFGHVNNAVYLMLFEEARWDFIAPRGFGVADIQRSGLGPTVLEFNIKFKRELRLRDKIIIESQTLAHERKVGYLRQSIFNEAGDLCCEGLMTMGLFDIKERKLVMPTLEWQRAIGLIES